MVGSCQSRWVGPEDWPALVLPRMPGPADPSVGIEPSRRTDDAPSCQHAGSVLGSPLLGTRLLASWGWKYQRASYSRLGLREAVRSSFLGKHSLLPGRASAHHSPGDSPVLSLAHTFG